MTEKSACKLCLLPGGSGVSAALGNLFADDEDLFEHIEMEHDIPVRREGETDDEARARVAAKNPRAGGPDCQCPGCQGTAGTLAILDSLRP